MQIQITIDDELMKKALEACDLQTATAVIEEGLRLVIALSEQADLADLLGALARNIEPTRH